ncbi:MAG: hypothetical protein HY881_09755 [Deltaproteobacteria bacterium]|nr:hypothetical protein [Deltaproteobacteria bacterium]
MVELSQQSQMESPLSVRVEYTPFINFATQQNAVPLLRALAVTNFSDKQATHLVVRVWSDPPVVAEKTLRVDAIAPGANYAFSDFALTLLRDPLRKQSECEEGHLWIEVAADGVMPARKTFPLSVLAYNEWYGVSSLPEIIAAHVLPNDPAVERILADASKLLLEKTKDGSLSGYQSGDPRRAYIQAAGIYFASARQKISYINPGERDPKTRTAEEICPEEIANAAAQVLTLHISMGHDDLAREAANVFGITRLGNKVRSSFVEGIELMKKNGGCRVEEENLVAP